MKDVATVITQTLGASRTAYWMKLRKARAEYNDETNTDPYSSAPATVGSDFYYWLQNKYGIRMDFEDGLVAGTYTVIDPKKEMLFRLKYE
jgi:hypothetical protein